MSKGGSHGGKGGGGSHGGGKGAGVEREEAAREPASQTLPRRRASRRDRGGGTLRRGSRSR